MYFFFSHFIRLVIQMLYFGIVLMLNCFCNNQLFDMSSQLQLQLLIILLFGIDITNVIGNCLHLCVQTTPYAYEDM